MRRLKAYLSLIALALIAISSPISVRADLIPPVESVESGAPVQQIGFHEINQDAFKTDSLNNILGTLFGRAFQYFFMALSGLAVILLIYAGIQYVTAGGAQDKVKKARQSIINILLAIILLVSAYTLLGTIIGTLLWLAGRV